MKWGHFYLQLLVVRVMYYLYRDTTWNKVHQFIEYGAPIYTGYHLQAKAPSMPSNGVCH